MPLSEHEQRVLEQIERALYADDPKFAATVRGIDPRAHYRKRYVRAVIALIVGLAMLPVGIATQLGITFAGFLIAFGAVLYGVTTGRRARERAAGRAGRLQATAGAAGPTGPAGPARSAGRLKKRHGYGAAPKRGLMERFEDRWNRRRERGYGN